MMIQDAIDRLKRKRGEIDICLAALEGTEALLKSLEVPELSIQSQGGKARAEALPAERRSEIAHDAAVARWQKPPDAGAAHVHPSEQGTPQEISDSLKSKYCTEEMKLKFGRMDSIFTVGDIGKQCFVCDPTARKILAVWMANKWCDAESFGKYRKTL